MLEIMKRNKILTYAFLMAIPMTTGNIFFFLYRRLREIEYQ